MHSVAERAFALPKGCDSVNLIEKSDSQLATLASQAQAFDWRPLDARLQHLLPDLIQLRRHLHRHPELSGHEQQTAALVAGELRRWGWQVREGVGRTGVLAELGPADAPVVALRVDLDALPIEERTGLPWASSHHPRCQTWGALR